VTTLTTDRNTAAQAFPERALVLVVVAVAAGAWLVVALTHGAALDHHTLAGLWPESKAHPAGHGGGHHGAATPSVPEAVADAAAAADAAKAALLVIGGWTVMVVAMMLPPALPLLQTLRRLTARQRHPLALLLVGVLTFVAAWTIVGALLILGDAALHAVVQRQSWAGRAPQYVTGAALAAAGVYQFTPLKRACLRACRSPRSFALTHWTGHRPPAVELATVSWTYAMSCVGCCWALMAVSLAVGAAALPAMVALAVVMAAERLVPWGRRLVTPVGLLLVVLGALIITGLLPIPSS
jgi:predicted metal-binding membrane protein